MKTYYGISYKSHGKWYHCYGGDLYDDYNDAVEAMNDWKTGNFSNHPQLKSKCRISKQKWIKA